ncbi:apyrase 2-like isoform C [Micractinium conductrix]|uniref:Apyrase 2-like isoform C n=1 Tax=Micractinium conductrix TaxID=554055 RepID=A0A2P6VIT9_9CHLO|nr:apyrase 2-like isoform C [Micractinium conductrix]|eukprot:PSC74015.1 apyrase 2-like isoform C [Micractinium conductrix]
MRCALNDGFSADSTGQALASLPPQSQLAQVQDSRFRNGDCQRANASSFASANCLCDATQPFLYCNALAMEEAAAQAQTGDIGIDSSCKDPSTAQCTFWPQVSFDTCCGDKEAAGITDSICPQPSPSPQPTPVCGDGPDSQLYDCCKQAQASGTQDDSCPGKMSQPCTNWPAASQDACCDDKWQSGTTDNTCAWPDNCGSVPNPDVHFDQCCAWKKSQRVEDSSCPQPEPSPEPQPSPQPQPGQSPDNGGGGGGGGQLGQSPDLGGGEQ